MWVPFVSEVSENRLHPLLREAPSFPGLLLVITEQWVALGHPKVHSSIRRPRARVPGADLAALSHRGSQAGPGGPRALGQTTVLSEAQLFP